MRKSNIDPFRTKSQTPPKRSPKAGASDTPADRSPAEVAATPASTSSSAEAGPHPLALSNGLTLAPRPALMRPLKFLPGAFAMSAADYLARPELGRSTLDKIMVSPRALDHYRKHGSKDSDAFKRGRVIHRLLLEPLEFWKETVVWRGGSKTKGVGAKTRWEHFKAENDGKDIITEEQETIYLEIADLFKNHPMTRNLLAGAATEATVFFKRDGVACKARLDVVGDNVITDVKTTSDLKEFEKSIYKWGYHRQGDFYMTGAAAATGRTFKTYQLVVIQVPEGREREVDLALFPFSAEVLEDGKVENDENLAYFKRCTETGKWPGYAEHAGRVVERPLWRSK